MRKTFWPIKTISFVVTGAPRAKARARVASNGRFYTPKPTADYEASVRKAAWVAMLKEKTPTTGAAVHLIVEAVLPIPASWSKSKRTAALLGGIRPKGKPDLSNIVKAIEDGCNGVIYMDDSQICSMTALKRYESDDKPAGAYVTVTWSEPLD